MFWFISVSYIDGAKDTWLCVRFKLAREFRNLKYSIKLKYSELPYVKHNQER